jgi:hypothetical protein
MSVALLPQWTLRERRQTKWVVLGLTVGLGGCFCTGLIGSLGPGVIGPYFHITWLISPWVSIAANTVAYLFRLAIPVSFAVAILRARLWDIDFLINRTLVGSIVTGALAQHFCVDGVVQMQKTRLDPRIQWSRIGNVTHSAGVRSVSYGIAHSAHLLRALIPHERANVPMAAQGRERSLWGVCVPQTSRHSARIRASTGQ